MSIQQWSETILLVALTEEPSLSEELVAAADQAKASDPVPDIVLDLSEVTHLNSSNLTQMLKLRQVTQSDDARLIVVGANDNLMAVFKTMDLNKLFQFVNDLPTALASLQLRT